MNVLIVEDDALLALDLASSVEASLGDANVALASSVAEAMAEADRLALIDFAFLDIEVGDGLTHGLARRLVGAGVPVAFVSGTNPKDLPADLKRLPFIRKPCLPSLITHALSWSKPGKRR